MSSTTYIRTNQLRAGDLLYYRRGPWVVVKAEIALDDVCVYFVTLRHRHTGREAVVQCPYDRRWMVLEFDSPIADGTIVEPAVEPAVEPDDPKPVASTADAHVKLSAHQVAQLIADLALAAASAGPTMPVTLAVSLVDYPSTASVGVIGAAKFHDPTAKVMFA